MAPNPMKMNMKQSANSTTTTIANKEILVRETMRISANLASPPQPPPPSPIVGIICCEEMDGRRWKYLAESDGFGGFKKNSFLPVSLNSNHPRDPLHVTTLSISTQLDYLSHHSQPSKSMQEVLSFVTSYVVPEGFPDSVTPSYVPYMTWRALKVCNMYVVYLVLLLHIQLLTPSSSSSSSFVIVALFRWSNGRFHNSNPLEFCWRL